MTRIVVAPVAPDTIPLLDNALRALSAEMGDTHRTDPETLEKSFLGCNSVFNALLACEAKQVVGALVWSPSFSTTRGGGGLFVSDLWVAATARGQGIGNTLLKHAIRDAQNASGACFVRLAVHRSNPSAISYYKHIGFEDESAMSGMILDSVSLQSFAGG